MGRGQRKIVLYENDDPKLVAKEFAEKHNLPLSRKKKLEEMLKEKLQQYE